MKDVSCWILKVLFKELEKIGHSPEFLCEGTEYEVNYLLDVNEYIDWEPYCRIMSNTRSLWNEDDYIRIGI